MKRLLTFLVCGLFVSQVAFAEDGIQTAAKQAIVIDYETGTVLFEKNADERMPTSSMSKVMSVYMVFDALKKGTLSLDDKLTVSEKAWRKGGSKMFVEVDKKVRVEDLLRGVIVQSGNDATIVLAEALGGSEDAFAENLTNKAWELGMKNSQFKNASGWPDPEHYSTARDLAILATHLVKEFPEYYTYFAEQEFTFNNIKQSNRNPLLYRNIGADGVKTGHTEAGGYGLMGAGVFDGRRVVIVVNGLSDEKARAQEAAKLLEWGLQRFVNRTALKAGDDVTNVSVVLGKDEAVEATIKEDLELTIPKSALRTYKVSAKFNEPLVAPVQEGDEIGELIVEIPGQDVISRPLYAAASVEKQGILGSALTKAKLFLGGWSNS